MKTDYNVLKYIKKNFKISAYC